MINRAISTVLCLATITMTEAADRQMENLTRGIVAVQLPEGGVMSAGDSWGRTRIRLDSTSIRFEGNDTRSQSQHDTDLEIHELRRPSGGHERNAPILRMPGRGRSGASAVEVGSKSGRPITLRFPSRPISEYRPGDASVADLDGDGEYEIVLHQTSRPRDNAHPGITGTPILDAYELDGTHLWRIDLGINIRDGEHYTQFMVYDLDGDGRAEVACKTADGTDDGQGNVIGDKTKDWRNKERGKPPIRSNPRWSRVFHDL